MDIKEILKEFKVSKGVLRWIIGVLIAGLGVSYMIGGKKVTYMNEFEDLKKSNTEIKESILATNKRIDSLQININRRFDEGYTKGNEIMTKFQNSINDQFKFIIDHRDEDKQLLKDALLLSQSSLNENISRTIENAINKNQDVNRDKQLDQNYTGGGIVKSEDYVKVSDISEQEFTDLSKKYNIIKSQKKTNGKYDATYLKN